MSTRALAPLCALLSFSFTGCATPPDDTASPDLAVAPGPDLAPPTISLIGSVVDAGTNQVLAGMSVCLDGTARCVLTDTLGHFTLALPASQRVGVTFTLTGYRTLFAEMQTGTSDITEGRYFYSLAEMSQIGTLLGTTLDATRPMFVEQAEASANFGAHGATGMLDAAAGCAGPIYFDDNNLPSKTMTSTGSTGLILWINCTAGDFEGAVRSQSGSTCNGLVDSWSGTRPGAIAAHLVGADLTTVIVGCN